MLTNIWAPRSFIISRWITWKHVIDSQPTVQWCGTGPEGREKWHLMYTNLIRGHWNVTHGSVSSADWGTVYLRAYWKAWCCPPAAELFMTTAQQCSPLHTKYINHWWPRDSELLHNICICAVQHTYRTGQVKKIICWQMWLVIQLTGRLDIST